MAVPPGPDRTAAHAVGSPDRHTDRASRGPAGTDLDKRRGHRPRRAAPGTGRLPVLTLADRLLATLLHHRLALPQLTVATLFNVRPETINRRIRDIRQLLHAAAHAIQPAKDRLATLDGLYNLASAAGITRPSEIKTAS